jgi:hypothetical protein
MRQSWSLLHGFVIGTFLANLIIGIGTGGVSYIVTAAGAGVVLAIAATIDAR